MFTEDYLMRIINQALSVLMTAIGLRKAGKYSEALQSIGQAIEQLTTLSASLIDQMDDASVLSLLATNGQMDIGWLIILGDLYQEQSIIYFEQGQAIPGIFACMRSLRFILEAVLADDSFLSSVNMIKIDSLLHKFDQGLLGIDTQQALSDYYHRLLGKDDQFLASAGASRERIEQALSRLQGQIDSLMDTMGA